MQADALQAYAWQDWAERSQRFERARSSVAKAVKNCKKMFFDSLMSQADVAAAQGDAKKVYKLANCAAGAKTADLKVVAWEDGSLTTSDAEYFLRFQEQF